MLRALACFLFAALAAAASPAQEPSAHETVELRVTAVRTGSVVVDRGETDGLAVGDRVLFRLRTGGLRAGTVVEIEERSAVVELQEKDWVAVPGLRGETQVPRERLDALATEREESRAREDAAADPEQPSQLPSESPTQHPPWENEDTSWSPGMPLLAQVQPLRPEDRAPQVTGHVYAAVDQTITNDSDRSDGFYRTGFDFLYENPFGRGGALQIDAELNYRYAETPDREDRDSSHLRFDRLSYTWGGTRFADQRWEVGRFLQHGMPEFGVLDGLEWTQRLASGHRWGASVGFMPEPTEDYETGDDLQFATWYRWTADASERLSAAAGFQKTLHHGDADRDLLVTKLDYLPPEGWTFHGAAWIDFYTDGDDAKGSGPEVTEIYVITGPRWRSESGMSLTFRHQAFPEIDRNEFTPVADEQLADDHNERVAFNGWTWPGKDTRLHGQIGGWIDEDDQGGDLELGVEMRDLVGTQSRTDFSVFGTQGRFSTVLGTRLQYGQSRETTRWNVAYEITEQDQAGFASDEDDIFQHRVRANFDWYSSAVWTLSTYAQTVVWDDDGAVSLGFYLQRSF